MLYVQAQASTLVQMQVVEPLSMAADARILSVRDQSLPKLEQQQQQRRRVSFSVMKAAVTISGKPIMPSLVGDCRMDGLR